MADSDPINLDAAFVDEDVEVTVVVPGDGSIAGWTLAIRMWDPDGEEILSGLSATISDAAAREILASVTGLTLSPGRHKWEVRHTDSGARGVLAWGYLPIREYRP